MAYQRPDDVETAWSAGKDFYKLLIELMRISVQCRLNKQTRYWCEVIDSVHNLVGPFIKTDYSKRINDVRGLLNMNLVDGGLNLDLQEKNEREFAIRQGKAQALLRRIESEMYREMKALMLPLLKVSDPHNAFASNG